MERRKIPKVEQLGQVLNVKNRVNSCLGICFFVSFLTFYFLLPADVAGAKTKFIFSWFSSSLGGNGGVWNGRSSFGSENRNLTFGLDGGHGNGSSELGKGGGGLEKNITFGANVGGGVSEKSITFEGNPPTNVTVGVSVNSRRRNSTTKPTRVVQPENAPVVGGNKSATKEAPKCDIFHGRWVRDQGIKPYYTHRSCPYIDIDFNCHKNGRPDHEFLKWRWQPNACTIPDLNATDFLERMRGKRLVFVGDSLNRNMWESLVCILRHGIADKKRVYEISGQMQFKADGYYGFKFKDYDCSIDYVRSWFLVREYYVGDGEDERLRLDVLDDTAQAYRKADVIVFNTGHWWTHEKTSKGIDYFQEGNHVHPFLEVSDAYERALTTWARWIDRNINTNKTQVIFRGYSPTHFRGGQWNSGGQCHKELEPIRNDTYLDDYPWKMRILDRVLKRMSVPVMNLNISRLTDYRKDGHPSIYRKRYDSVEEQAAAEASQDCSHWCLPGIPDTWNQLLYASLLANAKGSWN